MDANPAAQPLPNAHFAHNACNKITAYYRGQSVEAVPLIVGPAMHFPVYFHLFGLNLHPHPTMEVIAYAAGFQLYRTTRVRWPRARISSDENIWLIVAAAAGAQKDNVVNLRRMSRHPVPRGSSEATCPTDPISSTS